MDDESVAGKPERLRRNLLLLLLSTGVLLLCLFVLLSFFNLRRELRSQVENHADHARVLFSALVEERSEVLKSQLEHLAEASELKTPYLRNDRNGLLKAAISRFEYLFATYRISHFYFHDPDGRNLLRVHQPQRFGDRIERETMKQAQATGTTCAGLELGPLGTLTLRVVTPWFDDGRLIGYLELGEEFDPLLQKSAADSGVEMAALIDKRFLDRAGWESGMGMLQRQREWDLFADAVVIDQTLPGLAEQLSEALSGQALATVGPLNLKHGGATYAGLAVPLVDVAGKTLGVEFVLQDVQDELDAFHRTVLLLTLGGALGGGLLLGVFYRVLGRIEGRLAAARSRLEGEVADRTAELRSALNEAQINREQIRSILKAVHDPILVVDPELRLWLANRSARDLFGLGSSDLAGRPLDELITDAAVIACFAPALSDNPGRGEEIELLIPGQKSGPPAIFTLRTAAVQLQGEISARILLLHDVTKMRQVDRLKSEFISTAAHELNTPLAAIMGFSEILLSDDYHFSETDRRQFLQTIHDKAEHLAGLVGQVLDVSRIEAGRPIPVAMAEFPLSVQLRPLFAQLPRLHSRHTFELELPQAELNLYADRCKFLQVVENLLSNAIKYSPDGGVVRFEAVPRGEKTVLFSVSDQGVGMSPAEQVQAFDRFFRGDASDTAASGLGLGLTIARQLVESHGGRIWLESESGRGTTIYFTMQGWIVEAVSAANYAGEVSAL